MKYIPHKIFFPKYNWLWVCIIFFSSFQVHAQKTIEINSLKPDSVFENYSLQNLYADSNITSNIIWIKNEMKPHYHQSHTEQAYVLEGTGIMLIGEKKFPVKPGDLILIPERTIHALRVTSSVPLKVLTFHSPAYDGKERVEVKLEW